MDDEPFIRTAIIDTGTSTCKVGYGASYEYDNESNSTLTLMSAGNNAPSKIFHNIVGRPSFVGVMVGMGQKEQYIGDEAWNCMASKHLRSPMVNGQVMNWNDIEKVWYHVFYDFLRICPEENIVFLTEPPMNPKLNREKMTQIMFESFDVPALMIANKALLSLYSTGQMNGTVVKCGEGMSHIVPVQDGYTLPDFVAKSEITGEHLTSYTMGILENKGIDLTSTIKHASPGNREIWGRLECAKVVKEKFAIASSLSVAEESLSKTFIFRLPDGNDVQVPVTMSRQERLSFSDALYQTELLGLESPGLHDTVANIISKLHRQGVPNNVLSNVILSGGTMLMSGMNGRMKKEISTLFDGFSWSSSVIGKEGVNITSSGKNSAWIGASILSSISTFRQMWTERKDYDEYGPSIMHKKVL